MFRKLWTKFRTSLGWSGRGHPLLMHHARFIHSINKSLTKKGHICYTSVFFIYMFTQWIHVSLREGTRNSHYSLSKNIFRIKNSKILGAHSHDISVYLKSYPGFNPEVNPDITRMTQVWAPATESTESVKIPVVKPPHTKIPDLKSNLGL
jgi:hypothetical protein